MVNYLLLLNVNYSRLFFNKWKFTVFSYLRPMPAYLAIPRMFRLPNLVIVFLTQAIPYWLVLQPAIIRTGGIPVLNEKTFGLLSLATVLTTLGGYIINDYFDRHIDAINRPDRLVVGKWLPSQVVLLLYALIQGTIGYCSHLLHTMIPMPHSAWALWIFPIVSLLLLLYAWQLKCTPILGNILVAFLCGITPLLLLIPENRPLWLSAFQDPSRIREAVGVVWLYGLFAFATNLFREQIKDLEDFQGDSSCGCNTIAVIRGVRFAKKNAGMTGMLLVLLVLVLLLFWQEKHPEILRLAGGVLLLLLPSIASVALVFMAKEKKDFARASNILKIVMFCGLFMLLPYWPQTAEEWQAQWLLVRYSLIRY